MNAVKNSEILTKTFGRWPSFHDAEIVSLRLTREHDSSVLLEIKVYVFETTTAVDTSGAYVSKNHTLATFTFSGVREDVSIRWFNHQNVIADMYINAVESGEPALHVEMPSIYGADVSFTCDTVELTSAEPYA